VQTKPEPTIAELQNMLNQLKDKLARSEPETIDASNAFVCSKCEAVLDTDIGLKIHRSKCTGINPLKCPNCLKEFSTRKGKCKHIANVVCKQVEPLQVENKCPKCQCTFEKHFNLAIHVSKCTGVDPLKCPRCLKEFTTRQGKCAHIANVSCKQVEQLQPPITEPPLFLPRPPTLNELNAHHAVFEVDENTAFNIATVLRASMRKQQSNPNKKKKIPWNLRMMVWNKYMGVNAARGKCGCCKTAMISTFKFHCGHVVAECKGGPTNIDNLRPICDSCNLSMGDLDMNEFQKTYFTAKQLAS
jgi:hypothetical protein